MEAVQGCEKLAYEYGNQQIDQPHLLYSLLTLDDSLIMKLVTKMGIQGAAAATVFGQIVAMFLALILNHTKTRRCGLISVRSPLTGELFPLSTR